MKKIILAIIFLLIFTLKSNADTTARYLGTIGHYGIGVAKISEYVEIYSEAQENSKIVQKIKWDERENLFCFSKDAHCEAQEVFIAFVPSNSNVFFSVEDETQDWIKVCYDQRSKLFGWIKKDEKTKFYTWNEFLTYFGKKYGFYLFADVPSEYKRLYSNPNSQSASVDSFQLAKKITPWLVSGNWILVKVDNYDGKTKTGWLRYRLDNGRLLGFTYLK